MKKFRVYLYRGTNYVRGWIGYVKKDSLSSKATFQVEVEAEDSSKAINKAISSANNGFKEVTIVGVNFEDHIWGIRKFPELEKYIPEVFSLNKRGDNV